MMKRRLIIAEKPSVAQSIAAALQIKVRKNGYLEDNGYLVSWCYGHLAELADAAVYDSRFAKWDIKDLPIIPSPFRFTVRKDCRQQYELLRGLMQREDVSEIVNACDAGREGELIFRTVYHLAGCTKPILRLWISSLEDDAIRAGFSKLCPGADYEGLHQAALCRAKADWIVGINGTRFFSRTYGVTLNVGRVVSPTLALVVQRETEIQAFQSEPFYTVSLDCGFACHSEKLKDKHTAADLAAACKGKSVVVTGITQKEVTANAPTLFDLTTLQREANQQLGYTAQQTLDYAQALYEKKLCTYPRTDSKYLTEDMEASIPALVSLAAEICRQRVSEVHAAQICCSRKVTDHHAILPTLKASEADFAVLPKGEQEVLRLIARRLLCAVGSPHHTTRTAITVECCGHVFTANGTVITEMGWKACLDTNAEPSAALPSVRKGNELGIKTASVNEGKTSPPKRYTEGSLLAAMETAGSADLPEDAERKGIGTPATRAGILEKLVASGMVQRKKVKKAALLVPTHLGQALITVLPEHLQSPQLTAEWEHRLKEVERHELTPEVFLQEITQMLRDTISSYQTMEQARMLFPSKHDRIGNCPCCGTSVIENRNGFFCENKDCHFAIWKNSRFFEVKKISLNRDIAVKLMENSKVWLENCYSEKTGRTYSGWVLLVDDGKQIGYKMDFEKRR